MKQFAFTFNILCSIWVRNGFHFLYSFCSLFHSLSLPFFVFRSNRPQQQQRQTSAAWKFFDEFSMEKVVYFTFLAFDYNCHMKQTNIKIHNDFCFHACKQKCIFFCVCKNLLHQIVSRWIMYMKHKTVNKVEKKEALLNASFKTNRMNEKQNLCSSNSDGSS